MNYFTDRQSTCTSKNPPRPDSVEVSRGARRRIKNSQIDAKSVRNRSTHMAEFSNSRSAELIRIPWSRPKIVQQVRSQ